MASEIKISLIWSNVIKFIAVLISIIVLVMIGKTVFLFYPAIANSLEIENGIFNISASTTEMQNAFSASNLLSSVVMAGATVIYVILTAFLFYTTNKNTEQSAKAQKIAYIERRLENFYLPMQTALKRFDVDKMILKFYDPEMNTHQHSPYLYFDIIDIWWNFRTDYDKVVPFTYLAFDDAKKALEDFTHIFESNRLFAKKYTTHIKYDNAIYTEINALLEDGWGNMVKEDMKKVNNCHESLSKAIEKGIETISKNLAELVNQ